MSLPFLKVASRHRHCLYELHFLKTMEVAAGNAYSFENGTKVTFFTSTVTDFVG